MPCSNGSLRSAVAFGDDELVPQRWPYARKVTLTDPFEIMSMRDGLLLLLAPAREIGQ